jgi:hypothetical protein
VVEFYTNIKPVCCLTIQFKKIIIGKYVGFFGFYSEGAPGESEIIMGCDRFKDGAY